MIFQTGSNKPYDIQDRNMSAGLRKKSAVGEFVSMGMGVHDLFIEETAPFVVVYDAVGLPAL